MSGSTKIGFKFVFPFRGFYSRITPAPTSGSGSNPQQLPQSSLFGSAPSSSVQSSGGKYGSVQNSRGIEAATEEERVEQDILDFPYIKLELSAAGVRVLSLVSICLLMATYFDEENVHPYATAAGSLLAVAAPFAVYSLVRGGIFPWCERVESSDEGVTLAVQSEIYKHQENSWKALFFYITAALATTNHIFIPQDILASSPYILIMGSCAVVLPCLIAHFSAYVQSYRRLQAGSAMSGCAYGTLTVVELIHLAYAACVFSYVYFFATNNSDVTKALSLSVIIYSSVDLLDRFFRISCR
jgi:hypothetical protein